MKNKNMASGGGIIRVLNVAGGKYILVCALLANITEGLSNIFIALNGGNMLDAIISGNRPWASAYMLRILIFIVTLAGGIIIKDSLLGSYQEKGIAAIRARTVSALGRAKMSWLDSRHSGELSARASSDLAALGGALRPVLIMGISLVLAQIIAVGFLFYINWLLTLIIFAVVPVTTALQWLYSKPVKKHRAAGQDAMGKLSSVVYDCFGGFETVKSLALEREMSERFAMAQARQFDASLGENRVIAALTPLSGLGRYLPQFLLAFAGGIFVIHGSLTIGQMTMFLMLSSSAVRVLGNVAELISSIRQLGVSADRITNLWDVPAEKDAGDTVLPAFTDEVLSFENVSFRYANADEKIAALRDVSLCVPKGSFTALAGESGCGKSTVLKLAAALYEPDNGQVKLFGRDIKQWNSEAARANVAYVTQDTFLFPGSIRDNILGGRESVAEEKLQTAIKAAQLEDFIASLPMGLDTQVGERGVFLSGGQRQRISVARALCKDALLLLLDEATSALDLTTESMLVSAVLSLENRPALLMITHRLANIRDANQIIVMKNGAAFERGTHSELMALGGEYSRYVEGQKGDVAF